MKKGLKRMLKIILRGEIMIMLVEEMLMKMKTRNELLLGLCMLTLLENLLLIIFEVGVMATNNRA